MLDTEAQIAIDRIPPHSEIRYAPRVPGDALAFDDVSTDASGSSMDTVVRDLMLAARRAIDAVRAGTRISPRAHAQAKAIIDELGLALQDTTSHRPAMSIAEDGTWFEFDGHHVDVARRGAVRRILAELAESRIQRPGTPRTVDELFQVGWPGERIPYESQVRRVYTAIWTLRTLGLEEVLLTRDQGYLLDPKRDVRRAA
ncbi:MAG: hypothetical protein U0414_11800 [Polyangiaceae bacterium]